MPEPSGPAAIPPIRALILPLVGGLAGAMATATDVAVNRFGMAGGNAPLAGTAIAYGAATTVLLGIALGAAAALVHALVGILPGAARNLVGRIVWTLIAAALFALTTRTLFDGPWASRQAWAGAARVATPIAGLIACWFGAAGWQRAMASRAGWRLVTALACGPLAAAFVLVDGTKFASYPLLHAQLAGEAFLALMLAGLLLLGRWLSASPRWLPLALALFMAGGAIVGPAILRGQRTILKHRSTIMSRPLPVTSKVMPLVEHWVFDRVRALPSAAGGGIGDVDIKLGGPDVTAELGAAAPEASRRNVLWIAMDAMRADALGMLGNPRHLTPELDKYAGASVLFERAYSPAPASMFAYSALLAGVYSRASRGYTEEYKVARPTFEERAIPAVLKGQGFATLGLTAFNHDTQEKTPGFPTFAIGFDSWNQGHPGDELVAEQVTDLAVKSLRALKAGGRRFFGWIHYMDPHAPYRFHDEFPFGKRPRDGYDSEVAYLDRELGRLFREIEALGLSSSTMVVLFGDHGDAFGEHNNTYHGASLYDHQVRVPLIVHVPGLAARRVTQAVSLADLVPTTLSLLGVADQAPRLGRNLSPLLLGKDTDWFDLAYSERPCSPERWPGSLERMVVHDGLKAIWNPAADTWQVFDLARDPGETKNLFDPGDPAQARLMELMKKVDADIDGYFGRPATAESQPQKSVAATFDELLRTAKAAALDADRQRALQALGGMVRGPDLSWRAPAVIILGKERLAALHALVESIATTRKPESPLAGPAVEILALYREASSIPLLKRHLESEGSAAWTCAWTLAALDDSSGRALLEASRNHADFYRRVQANAGLARLGDAAAVAFLKPLLGLDEAAMLGVVLRGLARTQDPEIAERYLLQLQKCWTDPIVARAMVDVGSAGTTPLWRAILDAVAGHVDDLARERAVLALGQATTPDEQQRGRERAQALNAAATAQLGWDWKLARQYLEGATQAAGTAALPELQWLARCAYEAGDRAAADQALAQLSTDTALPDATREAARRWREWMAVHGCAPQRPTVDGTISGLPGGTTFKAGTKLLIPLTVKHTGDALLCGGPFPANLRFSVFFLKDDGTAFVPRYQCEEFLPARHLLPEESCDLVVLAAVPSTPGTYTPVLCAGFAPLFAPTAKVLWKGTPLTVVAR